MRKYNLVDFAAHYQKGFRNHIVAITEVLALVERFNHYGCYATYFFYSDEVFTYMSAQAQEGVATIAGYDGKVWAPFFPIDLDHADFALALEGARYLAEFFNDRWNVGSEALHVYFSGSKGFHLMLDTRLFGKIAPTKMLPLLFDTMRRHLVHQLPEHLRDTVDLAIKDRVRLLRLPNTRHEGSKLYKVLLTHDELNALDALDIRDHAREMRPLALTDETGFLSHADVSENPEAAKFLRRIRRQLKKLRGKNFTYPFRRPQDLRNIEFHCAGMQAIWESHIEPGFRNNCAIRLASELRLLGLTREEAEEKMFEWNEKKEIELPSDELHAVLRSAYQHPFPYRYSCRDEVLRRFCPLSDYQACRKFVASRSQSKDVRNSLKDRERS